MVSVPGAALENVPEMASARSLLISVLVAGGKDSLVGNVKLERCQRNIHATGYTDLMALPLPDSISTLNLLLLLKVNAPVLSVPMAPAVAPGLIVAPLALTLTGPVIVPLPPNVPVPLTVTVRLICQTVVLLTNNLPALTVVPPESVMARVSAAQLDLTRASVPAVPF